jgi:hypothetical protein
MTLATLEAEVDELAQQTTNLLDSVLAQKSAVDGIIAAAVLTSVNAAQIPLVSMASHMIDTQTLVVQLITR